MSYSNAEYYDMILCVGAANGSCNGGRELYRQRFVDGRPLPEQRRLPSYPCFRGLCLRLHSTGSFHGAPTERPGQTISANVETQILEHFADDPRTSTRRAGARLRVDHRVVWRTLHEDGQYPYHFRRTQELLRADYSARVDFCEWLIEQIAVDSSFVEKVLWTDEATFTRSGLANLHNDHVWAHVNPHASTESSFQHQWRINVWAGIIGDRLIGPIFLPASLNAAGYLEHLQGELEDEIDNLPLAVGRNLLWFQHDGAPAHFAHRVRQYLHTRFPGRWIGRGEDAPKSWPPRSPDLTPLDFFLWGYMKNIVYSEPCNTREDMIPRITAAFNNVTPQMLKNVMGSISRRARLCIEKGGQHFEPFL